jgi:hypothetical protein
MRSHRPKSAPWSSTNNDPRRHVRAGRPIVASSAPASSGSSSRAISCVPEPLLERRRFGGRAGVDRFGCEQPEPPVRALAVAVRVAAQRAFEVAAAEDQQPVECVHGGEASESLNPCVREHEAA